MTVPGQTAADRCPPPFHRGDRGLVSVIIPNYRQGRFLADAITSVCEQTYAAAEIIVVDDGCPDDTEPVVSRFPAVRLITQPHQGLSAARNAGLRHARGEYVVFLDADDLLLPDALATGVREATQYPDCAFVAGHYRFILPNGERASAERRARRVKDPYLSLLRGNHIGMHAAVMYRRWIFDRTGGFDTRLRGCEDWELYLRITRTHPVRYHDALVAEYRRHDTNMSLDAERMLTSTLEVLRKERVHIRGRPEYEEAYRVGVRAGRRAYRTSHLRAAARSLLARRDWKRAGVHLREACRVPPPVRPARADGRRVTKCDG